MATLLERLDIVGIHQSVSSRYCKEAAVEIRRLESEINAIGAALPAGAFFLDPPDGGDVSFAEQIRRIVTYMRELEEIVATNCDPGELNDHDAEIARGCHRRVFPENYNR